MVTRVIEASLATVFWRLLASRKFILCLAFDEGGRTLHGLMLRIVSYFQCYYTPVVLDFMCLLYYSAW